MADLIITERQDIVAIANAVRNKTGKTNELTLSGIVRGINGIETGVELPALKNEASSCDLLAGKELIDSEGNVVEGAMTNHGDLGGNITIDAENYYYDIPEGYHNGGASVSVLLEEKTVTPTDTQQIITPSEGYVLSKVTVEAASGGGSSNPTASPKEVNFYDYDGTLLYSYTVAEAQALTELPPLPSQPGLICQEWNYDLETIKSYNRAVNVGATYITDDGKTRLYIKIAAEGRMTVPLYFSQTVANGVTIDWGDGSVTESLAGTGKVNTSHTYAEIGDYVISLDVADECILILSYSNVTPYCVMGKTSYDGIVYCNMLQKVEIGNSVTSIGSDVFYNCYSLASITIPNNVTNISNYAFYNCYSLASVVIPDSVTSILSYTFNYCYSLTSVVIPNSVTSIGGNAFYDCYSLASIVIPDDITRINTYMFRDCYSLASIVVPDSVTSIDSDAFHGCYGVAIYDFTSHTSVPTLSNTNAFNNIPSDCKICVPIALYSEWIAATNWSAWTSYIVGINNNEDSGDIEGDGLITFYIDGNTYEAEQEMTWGEWINSAYNTAGYVKDTVFNVVRMNADSDYIVCSDEYEVGLGNIIVANHSYYFDVI